tara:strand:+ start:235 stop:477 length:243 start_codon:yes stop_codon:yes gene_type:complete
MIKNPRKYWTDKVDKYLVGRTIVKVEYLPKEEVEEWMWHKTPIAIHLDNGGILIPSMDDEGNDGGAIITNYKELGVIPVI